MVDFITVLTLFINNVVIYMIIFDFFDQRYICKFKLKIQYALLFIMAILNALINCLNNPMANITTSILMYIIINILIYKINCKKDIIVNISFFICLIIFLDILTHIFVEFIFTTEGILMGSFYILNMKIIICALFEYIVYNILKNYFLKKDISFIKKKDFISYIIVSAISFIVCTTSALFIVDAKKELKLFFFIIVVLIIFFNIYYIKMIESQSKSYQLENRVKIMEKQAQMMYDHYHNLEEKELITRKVLHDIKNHLQTLDNAIINKTSNEQNYLNKIKSNIEILAPKKIIERRILNVLFLDKVREANKNDIQIHFDIDGVNLDFIDDFDIVTIFSNILDNAIEAVLELEASKRHIYIYIKNVNNCILFKESNPCLNVLEKRKNIVKTTKYNHSGLGLMNIQSVLNNYNSNMVTNIENNCFVINILFFN